MTQRGRGDPSAEVVGQAHHGIAPSAVRVVPCEIWGVLNVTADSFSDGGAFLDHERALSHALEMIAQGAHVIDVGGESSRPPGRTYGEGAQTVSVEEELGRVVPVIRKLHERGLRVSVDTVKAEVALEAVRAGAQVVNDISCGRSEALLRTAAETGAELVLMHNRGRGERTGDNVRYGDVIQDVRDELLRAVDRAESLGVGPERIWIDPGIGFAKTARQSAALLARTDVLVATGYRVLVGPSRKSFIAELAPNASGEAPGPEQRLAGSAAAVALAVVGGAHAVRVHDVSAMRQAALLSASVAGAAS